MTSAGEGVIRMSVRAKFFCSQKGEVASAPGTSDHNKNVNIVLNPVNGKSEENEQFFKYTPSGRIEISVVNPSAAAQFEVGKEYYIDFTPAN